MSTHLPWFQSFLSFLSSFHVDQISHQQHKGKVQEYIPLSYSAQGETCNKDLLVEE